VQRIVARLTRRTQKTLARSLLLVGTKEDTMKKNTRKELALSTTTVRTLVRQLTSPELENVAGASDTCLRSHVCYTKPAGGCP
jgi:hypothetical protein